MMATAAQRFQEDQRFFLRMAVAIALFILFGFAQFAARGLVDLAAAPAWVHLHGIVFTSWLALFVAQNYLAATGGMTLHRQLGWSSVMLAAAMVFLAVYAGVKSIELHRQPFFFTPPYFLALNLVGATFFAGIYIAAILSARQTEWHRRLMLVATVLLMEPALGRLLPMPLTGGEIGEWLAFVAQLGVLGLAMRHDRKVRGSVHPALFWGAGLLFAAHLMVSLLSRSTPIVDLAQRLGAA